MMKTILPALAHAVVFDRKCAGDPAVSLEGIKTQLQVCTNYKHRISFVQIMSGGLQLVHNPSGPIRLAKVAWNDTDISSNFLINHSTTANFVTSFMYLFIYLFTRS